MRDFCREESQPLVLSYSVTCGYNVCVHLLLQAHYLTVLKVRYGTSVNIFPRARTLLLKYKKIILIWTSEPLSHQLMTSYIEL